MVTALAPTLPRLQRASGEARLEMASRDGRTVLRRLYQEGAAKIRLPQGAGRCEAVLINTSGGLTGGDRLAWTIDVAARGHLCVTTQAAEKLYRAPGLQHARVDTTITLGAGARLDWLPQETILFDGSALRRTITADLTGTASLLMVEAMIFGRTAMGETVRDALFFDRWRIRREGKLIHAEDLRFEGDMAALLGRTAIAGGACALATVAFFSPDAEALIDPFRRWHPHVAASAFNGKFLARFATVDGYSLRKSLVPVLEFLSAGRALPKLWAI
ncbi:MAG: urease accessory protein UreD [Parvibaculaceae bacterium]